MLNFNSLYYEINLLWNGPFSHILVKYAFFVA